MAESTVNPLISTKSSDSPLAVSLHPLVLITASDLITRHKVRGEEGPLAGILLGQQTGQETTAEHAFPARLHKSLLNEWVLDEGWTGTRVEQFKNVHKAPALEAVGWFTMCPETGPLPEHVVIQKQFTELFGDGGLLLTIHPSSLAPSETTNRKLPISIYESVIEGEHAQDDTQMQVDGEERTNLKFRSLPYAIDTDETEMIAIDYVAKGAGSAAAVDGSAGTSLNQTTAADEKGKGKAGSQPGDKKQINGADDQPYTLTNEEEDQIAGITTRLNSVKMLQSRLLLLKKYIQSLPASYLSEQTPTPDDTFPGSQHLPHLRNIQALVTRLSLLTPVQEPQATSNALEVASLSQKNDVALVSMLSQLGQDVQGLTELGRKFVTIEQGRNMRNKGKGAFGPGSYGHGDDHDGKIGGLTLNSGMLV